LDHRCTCRGLAEGDFIYYGVFLDDGSTIRAVAIACCDIVLDNAFPTIKADHLKGVPRKKYVRSIDLSECVLTLAENLTIRQKAVLEQLDRLGWDPVSGRREARRKGV